MFIYTHGTCLVLISKLRKSLLVFKKITFGVSKITFGVSKINFGFSRIIQLLPIGISFHLCTIHFRPTIMSKLKVYLYSWHMFSPHIETAKHFWRFKNQFRFFKNYTVASYWDLVSFVYYSL